jgi:hypothetical protein
MDLYQGAMLLALFGVGLWHHGRHSYHKGREQGTNESIDLVLRILVQQGIITMTEADEIFRNDTQIK